MDNRGGENQFTGMTFNQLIGEYRKLSYSTRDTVKRFERLMQAYLLTTGMIRHDTI